MARCGKDRLGHIPPLPDCGRLLRRALPHGYGSITRLTSGNNCRNLGTDLTRCNLVHNEHSQCAYSGGDYCAVMGVSTENRQTHAYPDDCNYFRNTGCPKPSWMQGSASGSFYAKWADLYVQ